VEEAIRAGAMGFSSSRSTTHVTPDNTPVPSRIADWTEVDRLVGVMGRLGSGIFQVAPTSRAGRRSVRSWPGSSEWRSRAGGR
jgi:N-acyl-D-aspartate/D-glutamate deacylase